MLSIKQKKKNNTQNLQLQTKMLIATITAGFLLICITSFLALSGLKYDYEANFPGPIRQIQKLKDIQDFYIVDIINYINQRADISSSRNQMLLSWSQYKEPISSKKSISQYIKRLYHQIFSKETYAQIQAYQKEEYDTVEEIDDVIESADALFNKLYNKESNDYKADIKELIEKSIVINQMISNVISLRLKIAMIKNSTTNVIYKLTLVILMVFMFVVIFTTLFLSNLVLNYVKNINHELQIAIDQKTKELQEINHNLETTIQYEIEQSRQKDRVMYQQARLASMGEMIQNIAHQWRQPLNSLTLLIQSFRVKFKSNKLDEQFIETQTEDGLRIAKNMSATIENFRNFFQLNRGKSDFSIMTSIQDSIKIISHSLKQKNIIIETKINEDVNFYGHENAFTQVILNLIKNAYDAIVSQNIQNGRCEIDLNIDKDNVYIHFKDNAGGVKAENMNKIFEPYFTTKHRSVGTGIGLYMTKQIIERQMYGTISASNANWIGKFSQESYYGAIFLIELPLKQNQQKD